MIRRMVSFLIGLFVVMNFVGCGESKRTATEYESQYVGEWRLVDISYYGAHTYLDGMNIITDRYSFVYPEDEESALAGKFNTMCEKYWDNTYITFMKNGDGYGSDAELDGSITILGETDTFYWRADNLGLFLEFSRLSFDSFGDGAICEKDCERALLDVDEQELRFTVDEKNVGQTVYSFEKV